MTGEADAGTDVGVDDARAREARPGWTFGLLADDPAERAVALSTLDGARRRTEEALERLNELWYRTVLPGVGAQYRAPAFRLASEDRGPAPTAHGVVPRSVSGARRA